MDPGPPLWNLPFSFFPFIPSLLPRELDLETKRTQGKVQVLQEELNVLRTYMDKEYPVKAVQIASLMRSIRNLSEEQQVGEKGGAGGSAGLHLSCWKQGVCVEALETPI